MRKVIKDIVLRVFPELTAGLHLDRYARVLAVTDAPEDGGTCERFRPRYAVDVEILTPEGVRDEEFPIYEAVPLPVPMGAGMEAGLYGFPEPGTLVIIGFAYGRPDHPVIRQVYPLGLSLPKLAHREQRWQQNADVSQGVDPDGNWTRTTSMAIADESRVHVRRAVQAVDELAREIRTIAENSTEEVGGVKVVEALGSLRLRSGGDMHLASVDSLNQTTARDLRLVAGGNRREATGGDQEAKVGGNCDLSVTGNETDSIGGDLTITTGGDQAEDTSGNRAETVGGNSTEQVTGNKNVTAASIGISFTGTMSCNGPGGTSLFQILLDFMDATRQALYTLADHTHPAVGQIPSQHAAVETDADEITALRNVLDRISE